MNQRRSDGERPRLGPQKRYKPRKRLTWSRLSRSKRSDTGAGALMAMGPKAEKTAPTVPADQTSPGPTPESA